MVRICRPRCPGSGRAVACHANVSFEVRKKTDYGDNLRVVGDHEMLGKWSAADGAKMLWEEGDVWRTDLELPDDVTIKYKVVHVKRRDGSAQWETGNNRLLKLGSQALAVRMAWNNTSNGSVTPMEALSMDIVEAFPTSADVGEAKEMVSVASDTKDEAVDEAQVDPEAQVKVKVQTEQLMPTMSDILSTYAMNATVDL
jgi:Starch binding domain